MLDTKSRPLNLDDWEEIVRVPAVCEAWGLTDEDAAEFAAHVYAAKFHFVSGSPGYVGASVRAARGRPHRCATARVASGRRQTDTRSLSGGRIPARFSLV